MLGEFAKYAFFGLKRKRRDFERSVLKYVSIKIPALTHSGRKSRVCEMRLTGSCPRNKEQTLFGFSCRLPPPNLACSLLLLPFLSFSLFCLFFSVRDQKRVVESPSLNSPQQSGGDGWCWANLQNTRFSA